MDRALYVSMTGAMQTMSEQAARSHNLANVSTTGFKADLANALAQPVYGGAGLPTRVYAITETPLSNLSNGPLVETGRELDVAIMGDGWLVFENEAGEEVYSRGGNLSVDTAGMLRNERGLVVQGNAGPVVIPESEKIEIGTDGTISVRALGQGPETLVEVDRLKLVNPDRANLIKGVDGLFRSSNPVEPIDPNISISTGFLEGSNVNAVNELTSIVSLSRQFEMQIKMMQTIAENSEASSRLLQVQV